MVDEFQQLRLFVRDINQDVPTDTHDTQEAPVRKNHVWWIYIDGASRNNPGPAGVGIYIVRDGMPLYQEGYFLGLRTNNQAEYAALLLALCTIKRWYTREDEVYIFSDSQLLVRQLQGIYKVRNEDLKILHRAAQSMMHEYNARITHIMREENTHADKMANHGIDTKKMIPQDFTRMLSQYDVVL